MKLYADKGIELSKEKLHSGEKCTLNYRGILAESGADRIYVHYGYGDTWDEREYAEMAYTSGIYTAEIGLKMPGTLNVCFKDSANNWDNNSYKDYSFKVQMKKAARKPKKAINADVQSMVK
jgi:hypothetical protein